MRTTKLMAGALTLLVLVGGAAVTVIALRKRSENND